MTAIKNTFFLLVLVLVLSGCIDEYESEGPDPNAFRIDRIVMLDSTGKMSGCGFNYNSLENRLYAVDFYSRDTIAGDSGAYVIHNRETNYISYPQCVYPDYTIKMHRYLSQDDDYYDDVEIVSEIQFTGDLRIKESESVDDYDSSLIRRTEYYYDKSNRLTESFHRTRIQFKDTDYRKLYFYENGHIKEIISYKRNWLNVWIEDEKIVFNFNGDKPEQYTILKKVDDEWLEVSSTLYTYIGTQVSSIAVYVKDNSGNQTLYQEEGFAYNSSGYLIADSVQRGAYCNKRRMYYKKGEGNARMIFLNPIEALFEKPNIQ